MRWLSNGITVEISDQLPGYDAWKTTAPEPREDEYADEDEGPRFGVGAPCLDCGRRQVWGLDLSDSAKVELEMLPAWARSRVVAFFEGDGSGSEALLWRLISVIGFWCAMPASAREGDEPVPMSLVRLVSPDTLVLLESLSRCARFGLFKDCPEIPAEVSLV